jgi:hypothetical protein
MAINTTKLIAERKKYLRELKPVAREIRTAVNQLERRLNALITRKRALPELDDLSALLKDCQKIADETYDLVRALEGGFLE